MKRFLALPQTLHAGEFLWLPVAYITVGVVALLARTLDLGGFVTIDEIQSWIVRSTMFYEAIGSGDYAATAIAPHPGVTTMWLGSAGMLLQRTVTTAGLVHDTTFATTLFFFRLPTVLVHVACILVGYSLLQRLMPTPYTALAAFLWAVDPFIVAYSRILHVDGLAMSFATVSLLAAIHYWHHAGQLRMLVLSAVCGALAILSKSPAVLVIPTIGALGLLAAWHDGASIAHFRRTGRAFLFWGFVCVATVVALWPVLWVSPQKAFDLIRFGVLEEGAQPHENGNFYLGHGVDVPDWHFYAVSLVLRLTPWTLAGVLLLPALWRRVRGSIRRDLAPLIIFILLFTLTLSIFQKKFNRYLVPVFPAVDILAAVMLMELFGALSSRANDARGLIGRYLWRASAIGSLSLVVLAAVFTLRTWHPYEIAYFNPLLGGAQGGARTFRIGWGEGLEQVAAWLNQQPNITEVTTMVSWNKVLQPYLRPGAGITEREPLKPDVGYVVVYARDVQGKAAPPPLDQFYGHVPPLQVITIHGVDYAWIYQRSISVDQRVEASFGSVVRLRGLLNPEAAQRGVPFEIPPIVEVHPTRSTDYSLFVFVHVLDQSGQRVAQLDLDLLSATRARTLTPGAQYKLHLPLVLPGDAPPGSYRVVIGFYDPITQQRLPISGAAPLDPQIDGPDAVLLYQFDLP